MAKSMDEKLLEAELSKKLREQARTQANEYHARELADAMVSGDFDKWGEINTKVANLENIIYQQLRKNGG